MSKSTGFGILPVLASACTTLHPMQSQTAAAYPEESFHSFYEVNNSGNSKRWETRIDFYMGRMVYSHARSSAHARAQSDAARSTRLAEDQDVYYLEELPFFAPKGAPPEWSTEDFRCNATYTFAGARIVCRSSAGIDFASHFSESKGLEWFEFACGPYTDEVCRYELRSSKGLFSEQMIAKLDADRD